MAVINYPGEDDATLEEVAERFGYIASWLSGWRERLERHADESFEDVVYRLNRRVPRGKPRG